MAVDPCTEYGLVLAIEDFVPVVLGGLGTAILGLAAARWVPSVRQPALLAAVLVTIGGLCKAVWKTLVAAEPCRNYPVLEHALFPCLAVGFSVTAWALYSARRGRQLPWVPFLVLPAIAGVGSIAMRDTFPLLIVTALAAITAAVLAIGLARREGDGLGVLLFVVYVLGTLILPPLAARPHQTEAVQWAEQATNSWVQLCYVVGAMRLLRRAPGKDSDPAPAPSAVGVSS